MRAKKFFVAVCMCVGYGVVSLFTAYSMLEQRETHHIRVKSNPVDYRDLPNSSRSVVQIWDIGTASAFLWHDVLQGMPPLSERSAWSQSSLRIGNIDIWYRQTDKAEPKNAPLFLDNCLILGLEAHTKAAVELSKVWLDYVLHLEHTCGIGLMVLGNPACKNDWLIPYLQRHEIKFVFLVYDSPLVDGQKVFSWPLGPRWSRDFEMNHAPLDLTAPRKFACNFVGTVFPNTSRQVLFQLSKDDQLKNCQLKFRNRYTNPDQHTHVYKQLIVDSDLTLSPNCINPVCSRTYEAISLGSVPVIEDVEGPNTCNNTKLGPYALLKKTKAPVIFVKDWKNELPEALAEFDKLTLAQKIRRRINLLKWYQGYKTDLKKHFLAVMKEKFRLT